MDLRRAARRFAFTCPRPLLVVGPGGTALRLAVEQELDRRGGQLANSPADADTLLLCEPLGRELEQVAADLWAAVPSPRALIRLERPSDAGSALDRALSTLRAGAPDEDRSLSAARRPEQDGPAGLAMADRGEDRDGLKLDQWHLSLGPVLPYWPAGLYLETVLQGDVLQHVTVRAMLSTGARPTTGFWDPGPCQQMPLRMAAAHLDSCYRLLAVAGWTQASARARSLRDRLLLRPGPHDATDLDRLARRVRGSRSLRWLLSGLGPLPEEAARAAGVSGPALRADGDCWHRLLRWLTEAGECLSGHTHPGEGPRGLRTGASPSARC